MKCTRTPCLIGPGIHRPPRELWSIVDHDQLRQAPFSAQLLQDSRNPQAGQRRIDLGGQALPGLVVNHGQDSDLASTAQRIGNDIHGPALVRPLRCRRRRAPCRTGQTFALAASDGQALMPVETIDPLVIHPEPLPPEQDPQPPVAEAPALRRQGMESLRELRAIGPHRLVVDHGSVHADQPAGSALAEAPPLLDAAGDLAPSRRR